MDAFGGTPELNMVPHENSTALICFDKLLTPFLALPRVHRYSAETMPSKEVFDEFRKVVFDKFELPRPHNGSISQKVAQKKVLFYAHEQSARRAWTNMDELLTSARNNSKYKDWKFDSVYDFGSLSIQDQAQLFNTYDVLVMVHGAQMANSIFTIKGTVFIEIGCSIPTFLGARTYLSLIDAQYEQVVDCRSSGANKACLECG